jgi:hypothetical protein
MFLLNDKAAKTWQRYVPKGAATNHIRSNGSDTMELLAKQPASQTVTGEHNKKQPTPFLVHGGSVSPFGVLYTFKKMENNKT